MAASLATGLGGASGFGENVLPRGNHSPSVQVDITSVFGPQGLNFFGHNYTSIYLNYNGTVSFGQALNAFTPTAITATTSPVIAPFWADVDTRAAIPGPTGSNLVYYDLDSTNGVFTETWDGVGYNDRHADRLNTFQLQLISLGNGDFDIVLRYTNINWTTGDESGGTSGLGGIAAAVAGYSAGDGAHFFQHPASGNSLAMLGLPVESNRDIPGVFIFEVRSPDAAFSVVAASADKAEGNAGSTAYTFTVSLTGDASTARSITYAVAGSGDHRADAADFVGGVFPRGTVAFAPGETSKTITVNVLGDTTAEADEAFTVSLSAPTGAATLGNSIATGTIRNDDTGNVRAAYADAYLAAKNTVLHIAASNGVLSNDVVGQSATASLLTAPAHGTVALSASGGFDYMPAAGATGLDKFTYRATGANGTSDAEVVIAVAPANIDDTARALVALTPEQQVTALYAALLGRGPDAAGFQFWVSELRNGLSTHGSAVLSDIASSFAISREAKGLYPLLVTPYEVTDAQIRAFIDGLYSNLFDRPSDSAGSSYWTGQMRGALASGKAVGSVVVDIVSGALATTGKDTATLMGKVAVSLEYVQEQQRLGSTWSAAADAADAKALLHAVTADQGAVLVGIVRAHDLVSADIA